MFVRYLFPVLGAALLSGGAAATALESSIRPVVRPAAAQAATPTPQVTRVAVSTKSLRPKLRPEALSESTGEAQVTRVSNPAFDNWVRSFRGRALSRGIRAQVFDAAFRGINYNADVVSKDRNQAEFKRQIWDYLDSAASPERVGMGQNALRRHRRALNRIEQAYGVEAEVVTAVWGLESKYGTRMGDIPVIEALSTLAFDGRRGDFFEKQLMAALKIL